MVLGRHQTTIRDSAFGVVRRRRPRQSASQSGRLRLEYGASRNGPFGSVASLRLSHARRPVWAQQPVGCDSCRCGGGALHAVYRANAPPLVPVVCR